MAMTGSGLASAIKNAVNALSSNGRDFDTVWNTVGAAIVAYIQANATVNITGTATGVTAGGASAPVTGTGSVS